MELGQLRALRELGDRGSIAAVAAALRVTPSSISQQISALQRESAVPLTLKVGRRTALTDAGRALARAAVDVEVAFERAEQAVAGYQREPGGVVSVAAFHSAAAALFGPLIAAVGARPGPGIRLADFDLAQEGFPALTTDHDLVVAHRLVGSPAWPTSVRVEPLLFEPLDLVLRRDDPLAARAVVDPADLRESRWVAVHEGFPLEGAIASIAAAGGTDARIEHRINEFAIAAVVVEAAGCIALMPRFTTDLHAHPDLVLRPLAGPVLGRHVDCLARPETLERLAVRAVLGELRGVAAGLAARASAPEAERATIQPNG